MSKLWDYHGGLIGYDGRPNPGGIHSLNSIYNYGPVSGASFDSVSYQTAANSATDLTTYTFSSQAIGSVPTNDRRVFSIVANHIGSTVLVPTISSATIGGETATVHGTFSTSYNYLGTDYAVRLTLISAVVNTGTTGTVAITFSNTCWGCAIGVYAAYGNALTSVTQVQTASDTGVLPSASLTGVTSGNLVFWGCAIDYNTGTLSGVTADFSTTFSSSGDLDGYGVKDAGTGTYNVSSDANDSSTGPVLAGWEIRAG